jgi:hypothetical protein
VDQLSNGAGQGVRRWFELVLADVDDAADAVYEQRDGFAGYEYDDQHRLGAVLAGLQLQPLAQVDCRYHLATQIDQASYRRWSKGNLGARLLAKHFPNPGDFDSVESLGEPESSELGAHRFTSLFAQALIAK